MRLPALFAGVFGAGNVGPGRRVRPLFASQVAWDDNLRQALEFLNQTVGAPGTLLHAVAGAPYFGAESIAANATNVTVDEVIAAVDAGLAGYDPAGGIDAHFMLGVYSAISAFHGLVFLGYEGGPDFSAFSSRAILNATGDAQRDSRFAGLFSKYLALWSAFGNAGPLFHFWAGASDFSQQYGCWGLLESMREPVTPKTIGFDAARAAPRPANALGLPLPVARAPCAAFAGAYPPYPSGGAITPKDFNSSWQENEFFYALALSPSDLARASLRVVLYTAMAAPPAGQVLDACVRGRGELRCQAAPVPQGGTLAAPVASAPLLLPLGPEDAAFRGLVTLRIRILGGRGADIADLLIVAFDASAV